MKAIILLGTLKTSGLSNTETLVDFFGEHLKKRDVDYEVIRLVQHNIPPGTYTHMGDGDEWPGILEKLTAADIIIFATPICWGNHSSETQKVIERLDELHDEISQGKTSRLADKAVGIIITGDSDGSQQVIGGISNFINAIGMVLPPYATLSVQAEEHEKQKNTSREELMAKYEKEYAKTADTMADQLVKFVKK